MFDNNGFIAGTYTNAVENGAVVGYELQTNITYYRGIPLSMVEFIKVQLTVATRTANIPVPLMGVKVREIEIA